MIFDTTIEIMCKYDGRMFFKRARSLSRMFFRLCEECSYSGLGDLKAWPVLLVYSDIILHIRIPKIQIRINVRIGLEQRTFFASSWKHVND